MAIISSMQDEVIRLFYSVGLQSCMNYDTANPVSIVLAQGDARDRFYDNTLVSGQETIAAFVQNFVNDKIETIGP